MKKVRLIALTVCLAAVFSLFGCRPVQEAAQEKTPTAEPTAAPTSEPTPEPTPDPAAMIAEAEILEGRHEREKDYSAPFKTHYIDTPVAAVHLEDSADYSEETLRALAETVVADVVEIGARTGTATEKVTVYVVQRMLKERPVLLGDRLFCTLADVESCVYREALCGACCGLPIPWKQVGLTQYVFGTIDESELSAYYADDAHALTASCAAVYLLPAIADEETVDAATKTAASMTAFIIENEGFDAFKAAVSTAEALPAWAVHLGIEAPVLPEGNEQAGIMTAESDRKYLCIIRTDNLTINVSEDAFAQTPDELYAFICRLYYGMEFVFSQIREELPAYETLARERFANGVSIDLYNPTKGRGSIAASGDSVWLSKESHVWHELVHIVLVEYVNRQDLWWQCEALADYYSLRAMTFAIQWEDFTSFEEACRNIGDQPGALRFWKTYWNIYCAEKAADAVVPQTLYNDYAKERAIGISELLLTQDPVSWGEDPSVGGARGRDTGDAQTDGNALSYCEATVMLEYLFDTYGAETVVTGYLNGRPLSETCGKDYPKLYADCIAYLTETYGLLLAD